jgi:hypothetical protein
VIKTTTTTTTTTKDADSPIRWLYDYDCRCAMCHNLYTKSINLTKEYNKMLDIYKLFNKSCDISHLLEDKEEEGSLLLEKETKLDGVGVGGEELSNTTATLQNGNLEARYFEGNRTRLLKKMNSLIHDEIKPHEAQFHNGNKIYGKQLPNYDELKVIINYADEVYQNAVLYKLLTTTSASSSSSSPSNSSVNASNMAAGNERWYEDLDLEKMELEKDIQSMQFSRPITYNVPFFQRNPTVNFLRNVTTSITLTQPNTPNTSKSSNMKLKKNSEKFPKTSPHTRIIKTQRQTKSKSSRKSKNQEAT